MINQGFLRLIVICGALLSLAPSLRSLQVPSTTNPTRTVEAVTVEKAIEFTRLADPGYSASSTSKGNIALRSPDRKKFVIVLRKGLVASNVNEFSMYVFQAATVFDGARHAAALTMRSSSNRPAITQWRWLGDSRTLLFLGEQPGGTSQIYAFDVAAKHLTQLTHHTTSILSFAATKDGLHFVFLAEPPPAKHDSNLISISDQRLDDLLMGKTTLNPDRPELFTFTRGEASTHIASQMVWIPDTLSLSPDGRYAVVATQLPSSELSPEWAEYDYPRYYKEEVKPYFRASYKATLTAFTRCFVLDISNHTLFPVWDGPVLGFPRLAWSPTGHLLFLKGARMPLNDASSLSRDERLRNTYDVEISIPQKTWRVATDQNLAGESTSDSLQVTVREDVNTPPKLYVENPIDHRRTLLLDPNPQLNRMALGNVETITWMVHGIEVTGGLYFPPDYVPDKKYPLVIQTHGYAPTEFSMDGRSEWSSNFAARPLAAQGMFVLQSFSFKSTADHDAVANDRSLGATLEESYAVFENMAYDAAIDKLVGQGLIDKDHVGIAGFSRTVWFVAYALTHSTHHYAAAILTDGIDGGYFQYIAFREIDLEKDNGGLQPFDRTGLERWLHASPGFNLDKVNTPIRIVALNVPGILEAWEWFAGLQLQGKPVDFVAIPDGVHMLERPSDRKTAMQGVVDWFKFWLCGRSDPDPSKASQYLRWSQM